MSTDIKQNIVVHFAFWCRRDKKYKFTSKFRFRALQVASLTALLRSILSWMCRGILFCAGDREPDYETGMPQSSCFWALCELHVNYLVQSKSSCFSSSRLALFSVCLFAFASTGRSHSSSNSQPRFRWRDWLVVTWDMWNSGQEYLSLVVDWGQSVSSRF